MSNLHNYLGVGVNALAIILGGILGALLGKRFTVKYREITMQSLGLIVVLIGLQMALGTHNIIILTVSLVLGGLTGELTNIQGFLDGWGKKLENSLKKLVNGDVSNGFIFGTLIYCIGAMAIMGSLESGLTGRHDILFAKALLDGTTAIAFASTMGIGISLSAFSIILYQGSLVFLAHNISHYLTPAVIAELTAVGGILILAIGLNILKVVEIRIASLLPAIPYNLFIMILFFL